MRNIGEEEGEGFWEGVTRRGRVITEEDRKVLETIKKIPKAVWSDIKDTVVALDDIVAQGGLTTLKSEIVNMVENSKLGLMTPILNELQPAIAAIHEALQPILPYITEAVSAIVKVIAPIIEWIANVIQEILDFIKGTGKFAEDIQKYRETWAAAVAAPSGRQARLEALERPYGEY